MSTVKQIDIKKSTYYFLDDIINIKNLHLNGIKKDKKSYKNILIYYIGYVTPNSVKPYIKIMDHNN